MNERYLGVSEEALTRSSELIRCVAYLEAFEIIPNAEAVALCEAINHKFLRTDLTQFKERSATMVVASLVGDKSPAVENSRIADDLLSGAKEIAAFVGKPCRSIYQMAERGHIPTFKVGGTLYARKSELMARLQSI